MGEWKRLGWSASLCLGAFIQGPAQQYRHDLVFVADAQFGGYSALNNKGDVFLSAVVNGKTDLYLNGVNYTSQFSNVESPQAFGINDKGDLLWQGYWKADGRNKVWLNSTNLTNQVFSGATLVRAFQLNQQGDALWEGCGGIIDQCSTQYVFKGTTNYNYDYYSQLLDGAGAGAINDLGQVLWQHQDFSNGRTQIYVDRTNITNDMLGPQAEYYAKDINNLGNVVWQGGTPQFGHAFFNTTDITLKYLGRDEGSEPQAVNNHDQVLWYYLRTTSDFVVMLDGKDISTPVVGTTNIGSKGINLNDRGDVLWSGYSTIDRRNHIYVNGLDLGVDALGSQPYSYIAAFDINQNGQVLWSAKYNNQTYYYLSTPVPEPAGWVILAALVPLLKTRRTGKPGRG